MYAIKEASLPRYPLVLFNLNVRGKVLPSATLDNTGDGHHPLRRDSLFVWVLFANSLRTDQQRKIRPPAVGARGVRFCGVGAG